MSTGTCRHATPPPHTAATDHLPRILLIEDEPGIRSNIAGYLEDVGFDLLQADSGSGGLEMFLHERPEAVLCDLRLPEMDGLDLLTIIAKESPETPVVIVSGANRMEDAVQALQRGAWDFVTKPIRDMAILETAVRRSLDRAKLRRENREHREHLEALNERLTTALNQLKADQEAGRKIQFRLLPRDDIRFGNYTFTRRLYPSMYLSGDFVDYFAIDACRVGFYMADVSGHGAASAFVTVMLKTLIGQYREAYAQKQNTTITNPAKTLQRLDHDLRREALEQHLTMFYGVIDWREHQMIFSNAGHFPHPIFVDGQQGRALTLRGRPIGLFDDTRFHCEHLALPEKFALLLASDGILEILPQPSLRAKQRVLQAKLLAASFTMEALIEGLHLAQPKDHTLPDDVALLLITSCGNDG